jgi:uncharacterized protein HemX
MSPQSGPKPIEDVVAPKPTASTNTDLIEAELEHRIPVKDPDQAGQVANSFSAPNPISQQKQIPEESDKKDKGLEPILKDVNQNVAKEDKSSGKKPKFSLFKKKVNKKVEQQPKPKSPKPVLAVIVAVLIAGALGVAAFYAFKSNQTTNLQSSQSVKGAKSTNGNNSATVNSVQTEDLANLSSDLQSKINSLNDAQDFNQADLSDQSLGL